VKSLAFWKKKKKTELREEKAATEMPETYIGEVVVELEEKETGVMRDSTIELKEANRYLRVINKSSVPIFGTELILGNADRVSLEERIHIKSLPEYGVEGYMYEAKYDVKKYRPPIVVTYDVSGPGGDLVVLYGAENIVTLTLRIKINTEGTIDRTAIEFYPSDHVTSVVLGERCMGSFERYDNKAVWILENCQPKSEYTCKLNIGIVPRDMKKVSLGKIAVRISTRSTTLSGLTLKKATSMFLLGYDISKKEKPETPGTWEVIMNIRNPYDMYVYAEGEIKLVSGEIVSLEEFEFIEKKGNKILVKELRLEPNSIFSVGPITVKSMEIPKVKVWVGGSVKERLAIICEGTYELTLPELSVMSFGIEKKIEVIVDKKLERYIRPNEIPPIGQNHIDITTRIVNNGGVDIGAIEIHESIPRGFSDPTKIALKIANKAIKEFEKEVVSVEDKEIGKELVVRIAGDSILPKGKEAELKYRISLQEAPKGIMELRLPTKVLCAPTPKAEKISKETSPEKTPTIRIARIARAIETSRNIIPLGEDIFELRISVRNSGETPAYDYEIKYLVPKTFEIIEIKPEATQSETPEGILLLWKISLEPKESKDLSVKVRGVGEYSITELLQAEAI